MAGAGAPAVGVRAATWSAEPELWKDVAVSVELHRIYDLSGSDYLSWVVTNT